MQEVVILLCCFHFVFVFPPLPLNVVSTYSYRFNLISFLGLLCRLYLLQVAFRCLVFHPLHYVFLITLLKIEFRYLLKTHWMIYNRRIVRLLSKASMNILLNTSLYLLLFAMAFGRQIKPWHCLDNDAYKPLFMTANNLKV